MMNTSSIDTLRAAWRAVVSAPVVTAAMALDALRAMELVHTRYLEEQVPAAERLIQLAAEMDRPGLRLRAELVLAVYELRRGSAIDAAARTEAIRSAVEDLGDSYVLARWHFVSAWIAYFIGDQASNQIQATRAMQLLPAETPGSILSDHLAIIAIGYGKAPEAQRFYDEALALAIAERDAVRVLTLHNNIAFSAILRGDIELATRQVHEMLAESERSGIPLKAARLETVARVHLARGDIAAAVAILAPLQEAAINGTDADDPIYFTEPHALPTGLLTLAEAHRRLGEWDTAQQMLDHAARLIEAHDLRFIRPDALREQAEIHAARGDFETAYREFVAFHESREAQQSEERQARARVVQASFQADRTLQDAERYRELAMRDPLTGLYNRRYMDELLDQEIIAAQRQAVPISLAIIDADFFKRINDQLSHKVGDEVLQTLARVLADSRPDTGTVCRLGGEEFVAVLPGLDSGATLAACETMRRAVAEHDWPALTGELRVTVSIGVTTAMRGQTSTAALLADADRNLYAAKRSGRNRVMADAR